MTSPLRTVRLVQNQVGSKTKLTLSMQPVFHHGNADCMTHPYFVTYVCMLFIHLQ